MRVDERVKNHNTDERKTKRDRYLGKRWIFYRGIVGGIWQEGVIAAYND